MLATIDRERRHPPAAQFLRACQRVQNRKAHWTPCPRKETVGRVNCLTFARSGSRHGEACVARMSVCLTFNLSKSWRGAMENRTQVAHYAATMARQLCRMCRKVELDDLAYLLEVAAAEAAKVRATNGSIRPAVQLSAPSP